VNQPHPIRLNNETPEEKAKYYNKEAAEERQATIREQIDTFFKSGGKVTKLPAYDEMQR
jgi:uncharacterized protein YaaW (UPF0174 family)